ncbi:hypothetical protein [Paenibacillus apiarius]|uniref:hypothetical protein n=1 Tax=Paenibacillus apiarius TaxID=46240 RepID=UPI003B3B8A22
MIELIAINECEVIVEALSHWSGERTPKEEYRACEEIKEQIGRHVDGCGNIRIQQKYAHEIEDGTKFDTLYEALEHLFDGNGCAPEYLIRYERPSDNGVGTRRIVSRFEDVIEEAWENPHKFGLLPGSTELTLEQIEFLDRVLKAALKRA